jgi:hypothetical protein
MKLSLIALAVCMLSVCCLGATDEAVLASAYYHYLLIEETMSHANEIGAGGDSAARGQIKDEADEWRQQQLTDLRQRLEDHFGGAATDKFRSFVAEFSTAERNEDQVKLRNIATACGVSSVPGNYLAFRQFVLEQYLSVQVDNAIGFLSDLDVWVSLQDKENAVPLNVWLARDQQASAIPAVPQKPARPSNPLRAAEAPMKEYEAPKDDDVNIMESMSNLRRKRRDQALENAQAGMQQVASERQAWEQEESAKKMALAQAEADAMRAQAQQLAAAEQEALEQRQNSWGNRLKRLAGATISSTVGAFTGGIGTEAANRAVNEIFQ